MEELAGCSRRPNEKDAQTPEPFLIFSADDKATADAVADVSHACFFALLGTEGMGSSRSDRGGWLVVSFLWGG